MEVSRIALTVPGLQESLRLAVVADLHNRSGERVLQVLWRDPPDAIAVVGDMIESLYRPPHHLEDTSRCERGLAFLREACGIAPVFYSLGNHEQRSSGGVHQAIAASGVQLLDNDSVLWRGIHIGGLSSAQRRDWQRGVGFPKRVPDLEFLNRFASLSGVKVLLCHHPEYYPQYIRDTDIDVVLSGHAHGGQWRFFGRGLYAPGQGLFPHYTGGVYENRLVVSRGLANTAPAPRLFNRKQLVYLTLAGTPETES